MKNLQTIKKKLDRIQAISKPMSYGDQRSTSIKSVRLNGYIELSGAVNHVKAFYTYRETWENKTSEWHELMLVEVMTGKETFLEIEEDDALDLFLYTNKRKMRLNDIDVSKADLVEIDDEEEGEITFKRQTFYYDDSNDATLTKNDEDGEKFFYWDFFNDDEDEVVGVEKWSNGGMEVSHGVRVEPEDIKVLNKGN